MPAPRVQRTTTPKNHPDPTGLGFGKYFADHMATMEWVHDRGWLEPEIKPYGPIPMEPAAGVLHYGQAMFEGLKAFRGVDGVVRLFRADANARRMASGALRLCMPPPEPKLAEELCHALVAVDRDWVPAPAGTALYLRPTLVATEGFLGVRPSQRYLFFVFSSPVGAYYSNATGGLEPVKIKVELKMTRAAKGGIGAAKAAANYAASLYSAAEAKKQGYSQVLWMDAKDHAFVEEVGTMNLFAVINDELVTPPLSDSILAGVTRDSLMTLARDRGMKVIERPITREELESGKAKEVFGSGTAAVVSPVGELNFEGKKVVINDGAQGPVAKGLYEELTNIQRGAKPDTHGWLKEVK
ncbi:MAG: branched-chain amino acid aminotransferase [Archangiaceae bacterium]|nr:branched-chain amino acid aminotransferase [Archangiaceae bacterium]